MTAEIKKGCSGADKQCMFNRCADQCTRWMKEAHDAASYRGPNHKNQVYINCTGACVSGQAEP